MLRFATGVFLGGALPLVWAVVTEFAPARLHSTSVVITMIGYSLGSASGGPVSNALIPRFGWEAVLIAEGVASLLAVRANGAGWATSMAKFGAMLGPWLAGFVMDHGLDARGTYFVFAFFPLAMVVLLVVLGRIQRGLPADADGSLQAPIPALR